MADPGSRPPPAEGGTLKFTPLSSAAGAGFWAALAGRKLDTEGLSTARVPLVARVPPGQGGGGKALLSLGEGAFAEAEEGEGAGPSSSGGADPGHGARARGGLLSVNTIEEFKQLDRKALLAEEAAVIWADIQSGACETDPSLLTRFLLLCYADLKKYSFFYWFAVPALQPPAPFRVLKAEPLEDALGAEVAAGVCQACRDVNSFAIVELTSGGPIPGVRPLADWEVLRGAEPAAFLAMLDPSNSPDSPGWPLRNALLMAAVKWRVERLRVLCIRQRGGRNSPAGSLLLTVELPAVPPEWPEAGTPSAVGWELNVRQKTGPRHIDLGSSLDPKQRAEAAADLNLKLMRWRAAPDLDLEVLASRKCLLLGAGTLGCAVARTLLGWGVRHVTFVDSGTVAFSNPVRQSLFEFADCLKGGKPKASAAAEALLRIYPGMKAKGAQVTIPMPGHTVWDVNRESVLNAVAELERLVAEHDVVFLLTDTRESRWLPTLLCAHFGKLALNAALGFDSYLVMRHGAGLPAGGAPGGPGRLGCYFCNDVVAPLDSTANRTMDQMCTVVRPGLAPVAGSLAVELMASVLQHPAGIDAPGDADGSVLGAVPHSIRGFIGQFTSMNLCAPAFSQCTACSLAVVGAYRARGAAFLLEVFNSPTYLEDVTGLTEVHKAAADIEWDDDSGEEGVGEESPGKGSMDDDGWTEV